MKHPWKLVILILLMFIITQFIGLYVIGHYSDNLNNVPYGMGVSEQELEQTTYAGNFTSILIAFVFAIFIFLLLRKVRAKFVMRAWFFIVIMLALGITFTAILQNIDASLSLKIASIVALLIALPLTLSKVFSQDILAHNFTELLIYPGIAALFVPLLNIWFLIVLLVLISIYDVWAVWKSKFMEKMADFQMNQVKVFGGLMIPYLDKKQRAQVEKLKKLDKSKLKNKKIKVNLAMLGGGDIAFTMIAAGVMLNTLGIWSAMLVILGAILGLSYILIFGKKKMYPAMPFISTGIFLMIGLSYLLF